MIPRAGPEGRAYTLAVLAIYVVGAIALLLLVAAWCTDSVADASVPLGEAFLALLVLGGAAQAPNVVERIGKRKKTQSTDYGAYG